MATEPNPPIIMTRRAFEALPVYSTTLPTGTTPGKRWRREVNLSRTNPEWWQGRYGKPYPEGHQYHGQIPIVWRRIIVQGTPPQWPRNVGVQQRGGFHASCPPRL